MKWMGLTSDYNVRLDACEEMICELLKNSIKIKLWDKENR